MDKQPQYNPWAEKLLQVSMPDSGAAWAGMEARLEREMPGNPTGNGRRWFLLVLLLLLLVGVCNCPGRGRFFHGSGANRVGTPAGSTATPTGPTTIPTTPSTKTPDRTATATRRIPPGPVSPLASTARPAPSAPGTTPDRPVPATSHPPIFAAAHARHQGKSGPPHGSRRRTATQTPGEPTEFDGISRAETNTGTRRAGATKKKGADGHDTKAGRDTTSTGGDTIAGGDTAATGGNITTGGNTTAGHDTATGRDTAARKNATIPALTKPSERKDSIHKKPPPPPLPSPPQEPEQKEKDHGWVIGVGLNQFFPIGGQKGSTYNSNGLTGTLSDYLPVPMVRYYLNHTTYLQLEAQFNTPQPTAKNLVISQPAPDTSSTGGIRTTIESSASIQQLYYFNIPLSLHVNPWDNLNIGTGLQWSHLSNAIGEFDSSTVTTNSNNGNTGSLAAAKAAVTKSFKGDTLYRRIKTNELRFLLDANYTYKHFVLGVRYNRALSKFIDLQLPTGGTTQSTNSSLQLYLRYILLDTRKKKLSSK